MENSFSLYEEYILCWWANKNGTQLQIAPFGSVRGNHTDTISTPKRRKNMSRAANWDVYQKKKNTLDKEGSILATKGWMTERRAPAQIFSVKSEGSNLVKHRNDRKNPFILKSKNSSIQSVNYLNILKYENSFCTGDSERNSDSPNFIIHNINLRVKKGYIIKMES